MSNITKYLEKKILDHSVGTTAFTKPTNTYAALFTSTHTVNYTSAIPTGTEVSTSSTGYSRIVIAWEGAVDNADLTNSSKVVNKTSDLVWTATATWGASPVTTIGIFDTQNAGNLLWFGPLSANVSITAAGDTLTIPVGSLTLTLA